MAAKDLRCGPERLITEQKLVNNPIVDWGSVVPCVNCASARYHLSPLPLKQNCGENRLKLCLPQKGQPHHGLCYSG